MQWFVTYKFRIKCCFSLNYCHFSVCFLRWCCHFAIWLPCIFIFLLSAKFPCFGFGSTNHIARNHIDKTVYGPDCLLIFSALHFIYRLLQWNWFCMKSQLTIVERGLYVRFLLLNIFELAKHKWLDQQSGTPPRKVPYQLWHSIRLWLLSLLVSPFTRCWL